MSLLPPDIPLFDAEGAISREYLLYRGYCCHNGCRNCPYGYVPPAPVDVPSADDLLPSSEPVARIVSLCPGNTEILAALGLLPRVVGVDNGSDWPREVNGLPRLGPDLNIDVERLAALRPDLVIASLSDPQMGRSVIALREREIPHVVLAPHSIADIWENVRRVALAAGLPEEAAMSLIATLEGRMERVRARTARAPLRPRIYWERWPKPLYAPGRRNWLTEISDLAGAVSVTAGVDADTASPSPGEVIALNPEVILVAWSGVKRDKVRPDVIRRRPGWDRVAAVREGRIHVVDEALFCRPSPRLVEGLEQLAALLHPHLMPAR